MIASHPHAPTLLQRAPAALYTELSDGFVVMDIKNGRYYSLNATASEIWRALETPICAADIAKSLCEQFAVEASQCEAKVQPFIDKLLSCEIVATVPAGSAPQRAPA